MILHTAVTLIDTKWATCAVFQTGPVREKKLIKHHRKYSLLRREHWRHVRCEIGLFFWREEEGGV